MEHQGRPDGYVIWWADFRTGMPDGWQSDEEDTDFHRDVMAWMRSLNLDPDRLLAAVGVCRWQGKYELHVDEILRNTTGRGDRVDPLDETKLLAVRRIIPVENNSWPARPEARSAA